MRLLNTLVLLLIACLLVACDSNDDDAPSTSQGQAARATAAVQSGAQVGVTSALQGGSGKSMPTADCPQGGNVSYTQATISGSGYSIPLTFNNCNEMTGPLTISGTNSFSATNVSTDSRITGTLNGLGCEVSYNGFRTISQTNLSTQATTLRIDGSYGAQCDAGNVTCSYANVQVDINNPAAAYEAGCKES